MNKKFIIAATLIALNIVPLMAAAQMATITSVSPASVSAGSQDTVITVKGTGFESGSKVKLDGVEKQTTYVSTTELTATIPTSDLATAQDFDLTISTATGNSSPMMFSVTTPSLPDTGFGPENSGSRLNFAALVSAFLAVALLLTIGLQIKRLVDSRR